MKQVKPVVIGYKQTGFMNGKFKSYDVFDLDDAKWMSKDDLKITRIKSKWRPVYAKSKG